MKHTFSLMKLLGICTFLWVQALQVDHKVDQSVEGQHINCLVCKNAGEPMAAADAAILLDNIIYTESPLRSLTHLAPASLPDRSLLVHGPPIYS